MLYSLGVAFVIPFYPAYNIDILLPSLHNNLHHPGRPPWLSERSRRVAARQRNCWTSCINHSGHGNPAVSLAGASSPTGPSAKQAQSKDTPISEDATELISQGSEAWIFASTFRGRPAVIKERFPNSYHHPALEDKHSTRQTLQEVQFMVKAQSVGVETPAIYIVDSENTKIVMERVDGITVEQFLKEKMQGDPAAALRVVGDMGTAVARMHDAQIIHGDLTTSNFMVRNQPPRRIVVIDFGLSFSESLPEEKAVDLYVLEQALLLSHAGSEPLVKEMLRSYAASSDKKLGVATLQELIEVRDRRRKRDDEMPEQSQDQLE